MKNEIVIYEAKEFAQHIEVRIAEETVWLNKEQISSLFGRDRSVISRHINNILKKVNCKEKRSVHFLHTPLNTALLEGKLRLKMLNTTILT